MQGDQDEGDQQYEGKQMQGDEPDETSKRSKVKKGSLTFSCLPLKKTLR